jgi:cyclic pyranopterin monophosphate synthase
MMGNLDRKKGSNMSEESPSQYDLTHFDSHGNARIVDVGAKESTHRVAIAAGRVKMKPETAALIREGRAAKGDVLGVAQVAAIMGAKKTPELVPMCHPVMLTSLNVKLEVGESGVEITARAETTGPTGVEMEALTAVSTAALTVYDMVKAVDRGMTIESIQLVEKSGGKSGHWRREFA